LGLSATPKRWFDELGTENIYNYFNDVVYKFNLEDAINEISALGENDYQDIIDRINKTYSVLQNRVMDESVSQSNIPVANTDAFSWLLGKLHVFDDKFLRFEQEEIYGLELSKREHIDFYIQNLSEIIQSQLEDASLVNPFINLFLAHCYTLVYFGEDSKYISPAVQSTEEAIRGFQMDDDKYNQAISSFYLALLHYNLKDIKNSRLKLNQADRLLVAVEEEYQDSDLSNEFKSVQNYLQDWKNSLKIPTIIMQEKQKSQRPLDFLKRIIDQLIPVASKRIESTDFKSYFKNRISKSKGLYRIYRISRCSPFIHGKCMV